MPFFQQFTGINAIIFYSPIFFSTLGSGDKASLLASVGVCCASSRDQTCRFMPCAADPTAQSINPTLGCPATILPVSCILCSLLSPVDHPQVIVGAVNVLSTLVAVFGVDRLGRRVLLLEAGVQMFIAEILVAILLGHYFASARPSTSGVSAPSDAVVLQILATSWC